MVEKHKWCNVVKMKLSSCFRKAVVDEKILKQLIVNYACSSLSCVGISYDRVSIGEALIARKARRPSDSGKRRISGEPLKFESHRCYLMNWSII